MRQWLPMDDLGQQSCSGLALARDTAGHGPAKKARPDQVALCGANPGQVRAV